MASVPDILDTSIFVHLIRDDATGQRLKSEYNVLLTEIVPAYCLVTEGEVRSLAYQFNWGTDKAEKMRYLLEYFRRIAIDTPEVLEAYAVIDAYSKGRGIAMGKNDVWIAAAAHVSGFRLLTSDQDFDHLDGAFLARVFIERQQDPVL